MQDYDSSHKHTEDGVATDTNTHKEENSMELQQTQTHTKKKSKEQLDTTEELVQFLLTTTSFCSSSPSFGCRLTDRRPNTLLPNFS